TNAISDRSLDSSAVATCDQRQRRSSAHSQRRAGGRSGSGGPQQSRRRRRIETKRAHREKISLPNLQQTGNLTPRGIGPLRRESRTEPPRGMGGRRSVNGVDNSDQIL